MFLHAEELSMKMHKDTKSQKTKKLATEWGHYSGHTIFGVFMFGATRVTATLAKIALMLLQKPVLLASALLRLAHCGRVQEFLLIIWGSF